MNDRPDKDEPEPTDGVTKVLKAARASIVDTPMSASEMMSAIRKDSSILTCRICHVYPCICPDDRIDAIRAQSEAAYLIHLLMEARHYVEDANTEDGKDLLTEIDAEIKRLRESQRAKRAHDVNFDWAALQEIRKASP